MLLVAGLVFAGAVFVMTAARASQETWFSPLYDWFPWITNVTAFASRNVFMASTILGVGLIYYFLPNTKVRLRDVWFGAVLAALLWHGALIGFGWYLSTFGRFGAQGQIGAVIGFLVWVFLSAVILLYGVEVTAAYARLRIQTEAEVEADPPSDAAASRSA
jgi:YihY family inner membrane protein